MDCIHYKNNQLIKKGFNRKNQQRYQCLTCKKIFTGQETYTRFSSDEKSMMVKLNSEGLGIRAISRVLNRISHMGVYQQLKKN